MRGAGIRARVLERHAVVGLAAQLLGAAQEQRRDDVASRSAAAIAARTTGG